MTGEDIAEGVDEILMNADNALCEELNTEFSVSVSVLIYTFFYTMSAFQCAFSLFWARAQTPRSSPEGLFSAIVWVKQSTQLLNGNNFPTFYPHL